MKGAPKTFSLDYQVVMTFGFRKDVKDSISQDECPLSLDSKILQVDCKLVPFILFVTDRKHKHELFFALPVNFTGLHKGGANQVRRTL